MSKKTNTIASALIVALFLILLNLLVWFRVIGEYTSQVLTIAGINAIIALGLNLISGFTGQLALGHAGFMAVGAYTTAALLMKVNLPMALAVLGGALMSALFGFLIGLPTLRLRGDYLAIVTLGFGEIIRVLMINLPELTGGPAGLKGIPTYTTNFAWRPVIPFALVYLALTLVVVLLNNLLNSSHGAAIVSIREDEIAANAMGVNVFYYKLFAFTLSALIGGLGGALYAPFFGYLSPNMFNFQKSVEFLIIVVLGGMGNLTGTVVAGIGLTYLQEILRFLKDYRLVIYPVILIIVMLFQPSGIMGLFGNKEFSLTRLVSKMLGKSRWAGRNLQIRRVKSMTVLKTENLSIQFGGLMAVANLNLDVKKGELIGLIGPNGAGKTTVFNMLTGVYKPTAGRILVQDRTGQLQDISRLHPYQITALGMARTFQNIRLFKNLTVLDNVRIGNHLNVKYNSVTGIFRLPGYYREQKRIDEECRALLKIFEIEHKSDELAKNLPTVSNGNWRLSGRWRPNPYSPPGRTGGRDEPQETLELMDLIKYIRERFDLTIILIEHDMKLVMGSANALWS